MKLVRFATACLLFVLATAGSRQAAWAESLDERISAITDVEEFAHAHWGLLVVDAKSGETLYERNADRLFAPASVTKLYSVAAALEALGPDYRFETPIYAHGSVDDDGRLRGDLVLVASGDLTLGGRTDSDGHILFENVDHTYAGSGSATRWVKTDPLAGLQNLAQQVADAGIRRVSGEVLIDARLFDTAEGTGSGPSQLTPILVNDNLIDVLVTPAAAGRPAKIEYQPHSSALRVDAQVNTAPRGGSSSLRLSLRGQNLVVRGTIPADSEPLLAVAEVASPVDHARTLLIDALASAGISVEASSLLPQPSDRLPDRSAYGTMRRVAQLRSPPLAESARLILKVSHNLHASTLPLLLAAQQGERTLSQGLRRQGEILTDLGVDVEAIAFGGGAGGDRADYVTPRVTVQLLQAMRQRPAFEAYRHALPVLGEDGTLAKSVAADSPARGHVFAKTGTLGWYNALQGRQLLTSKALAGYVETAGDRQLTFAFFVNLVHLDSSADRDRMGRVLGSLCEVLYDEF